MIIITNDCEQTVNDCDSSRNDQLPVGLLAQLVKHCTGIAELMGSNPKIWSLSYSYNIYEHHHCPNRNYRLNLDHFHQKQRMCTSKRTVETSNLQREISVDCNFFFVSLNDCIYKSWRKPWELLFSFTFIINFLDITLLCWHTVQKQESREMPQRNLTCLIRNNLRCGTLSLFSSEKQCMSWRRKL